jgi:outer membrane protein OmpA-like peptidoglycan-associated protein
LAGSAGWAQQSQKPVAPAPVSTELAVTFAVERSQVVPSQCCFWFKGGGADAAVTFWKGLGIAATLNGDHASNITPDVDANKFSFLAGPRYTYTAWAAHTGAAATPRYQIFVQGLFGGAHGFDGLYPSSDTLNPSANAFALQAGGGFTYYLNKNWGLRLPEADYVRTALPNSAADVQNNLRLSFGVVYHIGAVPPPPITVACSAAPASVFPGDPVAVTATAGGLDPKLNVIYSWSGSGVTGTGTTASVATGSLAAGTYTVKCGVKEGKAGKEGLKPGQSAESSASFTVKAFEPPTISCAANPSTIKPGESSTVTATGLSPQNRPLTYSYSAAAGSVSGSGATATFNSTGAPTGPVGITCNVSDDKGQTATANTGVTIVAPYVAPVPHTQALCSITFDKDKLRPTRVDNEAKACLDEVALGLQKQSDAKAVVVGSSDAKEKEKLAKAEKFEAKKKHPKPVEDPAAERAVNAKDYLVTEKGIDAARISVATSRADGQKVEDYLVPSGASFTADVTDTTPVDETAVKVQPRKPLPAKKHHAKKAQ